jgi:penicillin-binding protein 1A
MERVQVTNPADGGLFYWLVKLYAFSLIVLSMIVAFVLLGVYVHFARQVPALPDLATYAETAPGVTRVLAQDGTLLAEFATERREIVPLERVPQALVDAFVSTEDRRFFTHNGLDMRGTARALLRNLRAGNVVQGGSTITQQVAKAFLSPERTFQRKIKEAIFARRLEARYSKREILALYLNHIFLGNGAYGVQAAARRYFDRDVQDLDVGQLALIAGLARAPSRYSPLVDEQAALVRRATVLDNMVETGALARSEAEKWKKAPLHIQPRRDYFHEITPYFTEQVRRDLIKKLGQKAFYEGGFRVETTVLPWMDVIAQENVDAATRKLDKRQGWRGPEAKLDARRADEFRRRAKALYGAGKLEEGKLYLGLVEKVTEDAATVRVGAKTYPLPVANMNWASPFSAADATNDKLIEKASEALHKGDVVWVKWAYRSRLQRFTEFTYNEEGESLWTAEEPPKKTPKVTELSLEQTPRVQAALYTYDHANGYVLAESGGDDFDRSEFNRVTQACRQPGSAYKPIYYSLALDRGYSYDTLWNDKPKAEVDPATGELWIPQNIDGSYNVQVSLEKALVWSKNPPSVEIFRIVGAKDVEAWSHKLGITTPLITSPKCEKEFCSSLALGASCVHLDEITRAFSVFARNGRPSQPVSVRRVLDRRGRVLEDHTSYDDPWLDAGAKLDRVAALAGTEAAPVIDPRTAWLTGKLLREIVTVGHSGPIRATRVIAAGKTGTSSRTSDVWFIGYTSKWMTTAWIGDDTYQRQLGYKDASFMLSVPMWARYLYQVAGDTALDELPVERPKGLKEADRGGPLKTGFAPPPEAGMGVDGKPIALPTSFRGQAVRTGTPPPTLVKQKDIRVPQAPLPPGSPQAPTPTGMKPPPLNQLKPAPSSAKPIPPPIIVKPAMLPGKPAPPATGKPLPPPGKTPPPPIKR